jgi:ABC-type uncharacterized transport system involved in gliding motility auxiliary subunit
MREKFQMKHQSPYPASQDASSITDAKEHVAAPSNPRRVSITPSETPHSVSSPADQNAASSHHRTTQETHAYAVGYGKPPGHSRFQKGQSGNPKGRPKHIKNLKTILNEEINAKVSYSENGKMTKASKTQLAIKSAINKAVKGDLKALQLITRMMENLLPSSLHGDDNKKEKIERDLSQADLEILSAFNIPLETPSTQASNSPQSADTDEAGMSKPRPKPRPKP